MGFAYVGGVRRKFSLLARLSAMMNVSMNGSSVQVPNIFESMFIYATSGFVLDAKSTRGIKKFK